jgi:glycosyltransferase involved in cell wall biosynthesis
MINFDIIFIDGVTPGYYDLTTLESGSLGGTESSVTRLAEGLASVGLGVGVFLGIQQPFEPVMGNHALFMPIGMLGEAKPSVVIHLRSIANLHIFPTARQFVWLHDLPHPVIKDWPDKIKDYNVTFIAVSEWHRQALLAMEPRLNVIVLYSPVDEACYTLPRPSDVGAQVNKNSLVWNASPHKGLEEALPVFKRLRKDIPELSLYIMNPGYMKTQRLAADNVHTLGSVSRQVLRQIVASSLCLFYPSKFEETFGLIAAEANAMGTPVACYKTAALAESVSEQNGWATSEDNLIENIKAWHTSRPEIKGQNRFRIKSILPQWLEALDGKIKTIG